MAEPVVKSAVRALEVLEYFAIRRSDAALTEIADALGYPVSSASVLLASLVRTGYLVQDPATRRFVPTPRVALLGDWIETQTGVADQVRRLRDLTGETVILAQRSALDAQYMQVLQSTADVRLVARMGTKRRLVRATTGHVLLAAMPDAEIGRILRRSNADAAGDEQVDARELMHSVNFVRAHGYSLAESAYTPGASVVAARLPAARGTPPMAIGVGGPSARIGARRAAIVGALGEIGALGATGATGAINSSKR